MAWLGSLRQKSIHQYNAVPLGANRPGMLDGASRQVLKTSTFVVGAAAQQTASVTDLT